MPPGFVISTETCLEFYHASRQLPQALVDEYTRCVHDLEKTTGRAFGGGPAVLPKGGGTLSASSVFPLLLSVRSGAAVSMPGMMVRSKLRLRPSLLRPSRPRLPAPPTRIRCSTWA